MDINDNVTIGGNLTVTGGDITLANGSTIDSSANAGILLLTEDVVKTSAALRVGNNIIQASDGGSTITMDINDNVTIGGNLTVTGGDITLANGSTIDSSANAGILLLTEDVVKTSAALRVGNNIIQASDGGSTITMDISDNVTIGGNLTVTGGDITLANGSTIDSSANAGILLLTEDVVKTSAALRVGNNIIQASDGGSTITMDINDNVTIGGNLTVTGGDITLANGSTIDSSANAGILLLTEDVVKTSAALRVGNNIIQASDGGSTITMDISDNVTIGGNLTVTGGDITLANGSTIDSSANVGILLLTEDVVKTSAAFTVGDNLTVTGGDITLANGSTIDSSANAGILLLTEDVVKTSAALRVGNNIIQASDGGSTITMDINDNVTIGGNLTVTGGDITLANGSTIDSSANVGILLLTEDVVKTSAALRVGSNIIQASDGGSTITMDISDNVTIGGNLTVTGGDITLANGSTIDSSANVGILLLTEDVVKTSAAFTVGDNLTVTGGDITLANGSTIDSSANAGILLLTEDVVKTSAALRVGNNIIQASDGGSTITMDINDNVTIGGNLTVTGGDITLANGSTIDSSANAGILLLTEDVVKTSAALRVGNNIIQASDGGSTITMDISDNVTIGGNLTVTGGDITLANGSTIDSSANVGILLLTEDVVKTSAAFTVGDNLTVTGGDITLANGSTIDSSANAGILLLTEDVVKTSAALRVGNNIIQASDGGSTITMDINDNVTIGGNLTVTGGDITLANGSTIDSSSNAGILLLTEDVVKTSAVFETVGNATIGGNLIVTGFIADTAGLELIKFSQTENAVNEVTITNAITGNSPSITVTGDDNDIDLTLGAKGTGTIKFTTNSSRGITFDFDGTAADKTTSIVANSTDNRTLTLPDVTGTLVSTGDTGSVSNNMLAGAITTAKLASDIGVTRTLTAYASASSNKVESGAIAIPAGSLLTKIIAVVTTQLNVTDTNNDTTIKVGNAANGDQIATAVNIQASGSSNVVIVGLGSSTDSTITTNLSGAASISLISGKAFIVNNTNIHITVENASNISTGAVSFVVEYIKLKTS
jgi:phage baseplate assembly protein gpV